MKSFALLGLLLTAVGACASQEDDPAVADPAGESAPRSGLHWPQFRFNQNHTGVNPFESTIGAANIAFVTLDWAAQLGKLVDFSSPAIVNGVLFPILFLSGVFFPIRADSALNRIADFFPIRHFTSAVFTAFDPRLPPGPAHGWSGGDLVVMGIWGVAGVVLALRRFRWEPAR